MAESLVEGTCPMSTSGGRCNQPAVGVALLQCDRANHRSRHARHWCLGLCAEHLAENPDPATGHRVVARVVDGEVQ